MIFENAIIYYLEQISDDSGDGGDADEARVHEVCALEAHAGHEAVRHHVSARRERRAPRRHRAPLAQVRLPAELLYAETVHEPHVTWKLYTHTSLLVSVFQGHFLMHVQY